MRTYRTVIMRVDDKATASLDIFREYNTFSIFEHDINMFSGSYAGAKSFIEKWIEGKEELKAFLESSNHTVTFERI